MKFAAQLPLKPCHCRYNIGGNTFTQVPGSLPYSMHPKHETYVHGGKVYVMFPTKRDWKRSKDILVYDTAALSWKTQAPSKNPAAFDKSRSGLIPMTIYKRV